MFLPGETKWSHTWDDPPECGGALSLSPPESCRGAAGRPPWGRPAPSSPWAGRQQWRTWGPPDWWGPPGTWALTGGQYCVAGVSTDHIPRVIIPSSSLWTLLHHHHLQAQSPTRTLTSPPDQHPPEITRASCRPQLWTDPILWPPVLCTWVEPEPGGRTTPVVIPTQWQVCLASISGSRHSS